MLELEPFEEDRWTPAETRRLVSLGVSVAVHLLIVLLLIFGLPISSAQTARRAPTEQVSQPIAMPPLSRKRPKALPPQQAKPPQPQPPPPPPPPPMKEVELGPNSKRPDAPAKEAAAKQSDAEAANNAATKAPVETPPPPAPPTPKQPDPQPPAPQRLTVPKPGDYTARGALPMPTTSPWGPPKMDTASGDPPEPAPSSETATMGRQGLSSLDPQKWQNSFDDETSGKCTPIPDLGKNPDGTPVLATVLGRVLDTDGRTPMAGAHLQIMGTQFGTFSDSRGEYVLPFDPKLLATCRKQYVIVVAPGYQNQMLTLMIGPKVRSDDVVLRHH